MYDSAYPFKRGVSRRKSGSFWHFVPTSELVEPTEVFAVAGVDAVPGVAGVAVAEPECEDAEPPAGAGATTLRSMSSARSPVGAKYFAMMELIPLLLLSSSEKSS